MASFGRDELIKTAASCVLAAGAGPGTGRGSRKIAPTEWSGPRYWRLAGSIMVPGAYRLPEAFSDAAASQVREAMAVHQPDRTA